jgi:ubiquinol-cytochrome c reductase cytochrome b subunit
LGGDTVGGATLSRFFAIHVFVIPALIIAFIGIHLFLVLRHGISEPPTPGKPVDPKTYRKEYEELLQKSGHPFWPHGAWRDVVFGTGLLIAIALLALFIGPPALDHAPDPSVLQADPKPDWYLLWYFAVLALIPPRAESAVMILAPAFIGILLLMAPILRHSGERAASRRPWSIAIVMLTVTMIGSLWIAGARSPWSPNFDAQPLPQNVIGATSGPVFDGAKTFHDKACLNCHLIDGYGGRRGPDLSRIGSLLKKDDLIIRIVNGGTNMPAFGSSLTPREMDDLVAFLQSRTANGQSAAAFSLKSEAAPR